MTEAIFLWNDSKQRKEKELMESGASRGHASMGLLLNMNDEVIKKTQQYLDQFTQLKSIDVSKEMRRIARQHGIHTDLCIHI